MRLWENRIVKSLCILLVLAILPTTASCSSSELSSHVEETQTADTKTGDVMVENNPLSTEEIGRDYGMEEIILTGMEGTIARTVKIGGKVFFQIEQKNGITEICELTEDMRVVSRLQLQGTSGTISVCSNQGNEIPILSIDAEANYILEMYDGESLCNRQILPMLPEYENNMILHCLISPNGIIAITMSEILLLNLDGTLKENMGPYIIAASGIFMKDGTAVIAREVLDDPTTVNHHTEVMVLDDHLNRISLFRSEMQFEAFFEDNGEKDTILAKSSNSLFEFNYVTNRRRAIIDLYSSGIYPNYIGKWDEDSFLCVDKNKAGIWRPLENNEKEVISLWTYQLNYCMDSLIKEYNRSNNKYFIKVIDYSTLNISQNDTSGLTRMKADLIAGKAPDLYDLSNLPVEDYVKAGLLEDIEEMFDTNADDPMRKIQPTVKDALKENGQLYYLTPSFSILVTCCDPSVINGTDHWDNEAFFECIKQDTAQSLFGPELTREQFLSFVLLFNKQQYFNTQTGYCDFSNSDFGLFLEYAKGLPADIQDAHSQYWARAYVGEQKVIMFWLDAQCLNQISFANAVFSEHAQFVGFPTSGGSGLAIVPSALVGVSKTASNKAGVIDFLEFIISEPVQTSSLIPDFPISEEGLEYKLSQWVKNYELFPAILNTYYGNSFIQIHGKTEVAEAIQCTKDLIARADTLAVFDDQLFQIVMVESEPFFQDSITLDKAVQSIESKARIYINEQYA